MGKIIDITGQRFGSLVALYPTRKNNRMAWHCKCDCGNEVDVDSNNLRHGKSTSCGCQKSKLISDKLTKDLVGKKFNKLTVIRATNERQSGAILWECKCDCGNITYVPTGNLTSGHTKSCGCLNTSSKNIVDLTGKKFMKLKVIRFLRVENNESVWECQCDCGNKCEAIGWHLTKGIKKSCGCLKSKGEMKIASLLEENNIPFQQEKMFDTCIFPDTGKKARFDFFVNNQYLIEYDGEQHFYCVNSGWSNEAQLKKTQDHDAFKTQWCKDNGYSLIRIPYTKFNTLNINDLILKENNK